MKIDYRKCGDYFIPNLVISNNTVFDKLKVDQKITIL